MHRASQLSIIIFVFTVAFILMAPSVAKADSVTEWNIRVCEIAGPANFDTPTANRMAGVMHTAIYEAVNAITKRYAASALKIEAPAGASVDAAIAAAGRATLSALAPAKEQEIAAAYQASLAKIPDGKGKSDGIAVGEKAAAEILAARLEDGFTSVETYRPYTIAGVYVPTILPVTPHWPQRKPWLMTSPSQFRPGPPPDLKSELWARDYNEIMAIGRKNGSTRTAEQTDIARFWEATGLPIYHGAVRSVADQPGREIKNARFMMAVTQALDDATIAVFDAKYHYKFWRPITAIRNGDIDGNDATTRDASWVPLINTPMHPEYPSAHCILSSTVGTVLQAEIGNGKMPVLTTTSSTANNARRTWMKIEDFIKEVEYGRIYDGVHYRNSTEVGTAMGRQIGKLAAAKYISAPK